MVHANYVEFEGGIFDTCKIICLKLMVISQSTGMRYNRKLQACMDFICLGLISWQLFLRGYPMNLYALIANDVVYRNQYELAWASIFPIQCKLTMLRTLFTDTLLANCI